MANTLIFLLKNVSSFCICKCKSYPHLFSKIPDIVLTRPVNSLTTNERFKPMMLWTTGTQVYRKANRISWVVSLVKKKPAQNLPSVSSPLDTNQKKMVFNANAVSEDPGQPAHLHIRCYSLDTVRMYRQMVNVRISEQLCEQFGLSLHFSSGIYS